MFDEVIFIDIAMINVDVDDNGDNADDYYFLLISIIHDDGCSLSASNAMV